MNFLKQSTHINLIKLFIVISVIIISIFTRLAIFNQQGGDHLIYKSAVLDFTAGINPYIYTVNSFTNSTLDHGYAYTPTLLYIISLMWQINVVTGWNIPTAILWKIPVFLADFGIFFLLFRYFYKKSFILAVLVGGVWLLNPYFTARYEYTLFDPVQIFFLLLAVTLLGKRDGLAGVFFGLAVSIKLIPLIIFPIIIYFAKNRLRLLFWLIITFLAISLPFMFNRSDFEYYIKGAFLVHEGREIQGRPLLSFATYNLNRYGVNFFQNEYYSAYAFLALVSGQILSLYLIIKKNYKKVYALCFISFSCYYFFAPILNRTHLLWFFPFMLIGLYEIFSKRMIVYLSTVVVFYTAMFMYLYPWDGSITPSLTEPGNLHMGRNKSTAERAGMRRTIVNTYYDYRHRWFEK